ncbi:hypothetical protein QGN29_00590 [Temperatibacter marinus]|uniref:GAF domain-containing protein n=1 Tax=Temperatibacter marinus TaxID=1456591 RepID=A0AA52HAQ7_9PROT|nr:hypothetical protein [Temperatibacter marinus]WND02858.1 hypothetical protein QGN29_00590 [Temperatibacter marinus]
MKYINDLLEKFANKESFSPAEKAEILRAVCLDSAALSGADLTSFWQYDTDQQAITCVHSYDRLSLRDVTGVVLTAEKYPAYFRAICEDSGIIANDAVSYRVTKEFNNGYFDEYGIVSLMDFIIRDDQGDPKAIICCENRETIMGWDMQALNKLRALATLVQFHF